MIANLFCYHLQIILFLSKDQSSSNEEEDEYMSRIPYSNAIGSIMYLIVCTRLDLAHAVNTLSRFMTNLGPNH